MQTQKYKTEKIRKNDNNNKNKKKFFNVIIILFNKKQSQNNNKMGKNNIKTNYNYIRIKHKEYYLLKQCNINKEKQIIRKQHCYDYLINNQFWDILVFENRMDIYCTAFYILYKDSQTHQIGI